MIDFEFIHKLEATDLVDAVYKTSRILGVWEGIRGVVWTPQETTVETVPELWRYNKAQNYTKPEEGGTYWTYLKNGLVIPPESKNKILYGLEPISADSFAENLSHAGSRDDFILLANIFNEIAWESQSTYTSLVPQPHYDGVMKDGKIKASEVFLGRNLAIIVTRQIRGTVIYDGSLSNSGRSCELQTGSYLFFLEEFGQDSRMGLLHSSPDFKSFIPRLNDVIHCQSLKPGEMGT